MAAAYFPGRFSFHLVLSCLVLCCLVLSCLALSLLILSCLVLSCLLLSCVVSSRFALSYIFTLYSKMKVVIWTGRSVLLVMIVLFFMLGAGLGVASKNFYSILGVSKVVLPRIVLSSRVLSQTITLRLTLNLTLTLDLTLILTLILTLTNTNPNSNPNH